MEVHSPVTTQGEEDSEKQHWFSVTLEAAHGREGSFQPSAWHFVVPCLEFSRRGEE